MGSEQDAGPEMDRLIAERIFGVKRLYDCEGKPCQADEPWPLYIPSGKPWRTHHIDAVPLPRYSTNVAVAMTVFEAMVEMTGSGSISADMEDARGQGFIVSVWLGFDDDAVGATGPLPLAICRAALSALAAVRGAGDGEAG